MITTSSAVSRLRRRRARSSGCSLGAAAFCAMITQKIMEFDKKVHEKVVMPIVTGYEQWFDGNDGSGSIACSYSEYSIAYHVCITITMPKNADQVLLEEIKKRIHVHAYDFFWQKRSRNVYVDLLRDDGMRIQQFEYAEPSFESDRGDD